MSNLPKVSVIIPILNEVKYIERCIESILGNDYPRNLIEILVVDGGSTDGTIQLLLNLEKLGEIKLLPNPQKRQVFALNIGIKEASGEVIMRADGHSYYQSDLISQCVQMLTSGLCENVGGRPTPVGRTYIGKAIAAALASPFGNGAASWRNSQEKRYVDTVFPGAWLKSTLLNVGGFDEKMFYNEDYELNIRIRRMGGRILYLPTIASTYFVRDSYFDLARQYFNYGRWRVVTAKKHKSSFAIRQILVPSASLSIVTSIFIYVFSGSIIWLLPILIYATLCVVSALHEARSRSQMALIPAIIFSYPVLHFSWSAGFFFSLFKLPVKFQDISSPSPETSSE